MKILHININYPVRPRLHGTMLRHLDNCGVENVMFAPANNDLCKENIDIADNVHVVKCFNTIDRVLFDYKQYKIKKALLDNVDVESFDCIHAHTLFSDGNCARNLSIRYGIPYIVAVRNTDVNTFFKYAFYLRARGIRIMRDAKRIVFLSKAYRDYVIREYVPSAYKEDFLKKSAIIPNGIDDFWLLNKYIRDRAYKKPYRLHIVYVGEITKNKNIPTIQKTVRILKDRGYDASLTIVGNIVEKNEFERIKRDECTKYIERVPKETLINLYRESDIFIMPSFTESFGLVYAEAMSQGLPVIYTQGQGFDKQFAEGEVGFHVDPHSARDIADKVELIMTGYNDITKRCVTLVDRFDWDILVHEYFDIYDEITR